MHKITRKNFPAVLQRVRREKNLTVRELAAQLGISPRTLEGWEQGRVPKGLPETVRFFLANR